MYENILAPVMGLDESVSFLAAEPLNCSFWHTTCWSFISPRASPALDAGMSGLGDVLITLPYAWQSGIVRGALGICDFVWVRLRLHESPNGRLREDRERKKQAKGAAMRIGHCAGCALSSEHRRRLRHTTLQNK
jgi:hypothetical protein